MTALQRWLEAMRDVARLPDAVTEDIRIERFAPAPRGTPAEAPEEVIAGLAAVETWLRRSPKHVAFELAGEPVITGDRLTVEYLYRGEGWSNGGTWTVRLAGDKIAELAHRPYTFAV